MSRLRAAIGLCLVALCVSGGAQVAHVAKGFQFRMLLRKGEKLNFAAPCEIAGLTPKPIRIACHLSLRVLAVDRDGIAKIAGVFSAPKLGGGQLLPDHSGTMRVDRRGRILDQTQGLIGFCIVYPVAPVAVGGSFAAPVPVVLGGDLSKGATTVNGRFTFVGFVKSAGRRLAKLTFKVAGNRAPSGVLLIDPKDGIVRRYSSSFFVTPPGSDPATARPLKTTVTILRK